MDNYQIRLLKKMLKIYSPSGQEKELSSFLHGELKRLGFNSRRDDVGNVIGESGQGSPSVLLCGHMDTVPGDLSVKTAKEKIRARGAVDAKSSLAAMIGGATEAREDFPGKITVLGVVDEECRGTGIRHFVQKSQMNVDYAVFGEPSNTENIVIGYKGLMHLRLECGTKAGHAAVPWLHDNAVEKSVEIWSLIRSGFAESGESPFQSVTGCLTGIAGGNAINVVPSKCTFTIDIRIPPDTSSSSVLRSIRKKIGSYLNDNPNVTIDLDIMDQVEGCLMNPDSVIARSFSWAIRRIRGKSPVFLKKTGTSDMNLLACRTRIPMIAYGPGDSRLDHTDQEEISFKDYLASIEIYEEALKRLAVLHEKTN